MSLESKTILITGAAGGLGSALAEACASKGANLILLDKNHRTLGKLSDTITESGSSPPGPGDPARSPLPRPRTRW